MPDVSIIHDRGALLIIGTGIGKIRIDLDIGHRNMKEVHIHPATHIEPDLDKKIRIIVAAPSYIRGASIEMTPEHLVSAGGDILPP